MITQDNIYKALNACVTQHSNKNYLLFMTVVISGLIRKRNVWITDDGENNNIACRGPWAGVSEKETADF